MTNLDNDDLDLLLEESEPLESEAENPLVPKKKKMTAQERRLMNCKNLEKAREARKAKSKSARSEKAKQVREQKKDEDQSKLAKTILEQIDEKLKSHSNMSESKLAETILKELDHPNIIKIYEFYQD